MKKITIFLLSVTFVFAHELIELGDFSQEMADKYNQDIIIIDNSAYLVPSECLSTHLYGGISQGNIWLNEIKKEHITLDSKTFTNLNQVSIDAQKQRQNLIAKVEQKSPKEFVDDSGGHLYGGISQHKIDLSTQKVLIAPKVVKQSRKTYNCKVLQNYNGYTIDTKIFKLYRDGTLQEREDGFVEFH